MPHKLRKMLCASGRTTRAALISATALLCAAAAVPDSTSVDEAIGVIEQLHGALREQAAAKRDIDDRYLSLAPVIAATHDLNYISRFALRRFWNDLTSKQQESFNERFTLFSVMNYASRFANLASNALQIQDALTTGDARVQVNALIVTEEQRRVTLAYVLHYREGNWRIVNIVADGVSDLALRRSEYSRIMREQQFEGLLEHIDQQIAALR